ncbi:MULTISPECIES: DUF5132 domain-containing protein [unclassified Rhodosalinus]|uniref:DUF5132 domain-containing protein n=1 Tax=unclassified Rhodosalinus TaxID=2630183 RepID=UPI0035256903
MNKSFLLGATVAVGAVMLIPGVAPAVGRASKPLARAALRTGTVAYDEFRKAGAEAFEHFEDIAAEIREEMEAERHAAAQEAAGTAAPGAADDAD